VNFKPRSSSTHCYAVFPQLSLLRLSLGGCRPIRLLEKDCPYEQVPPVNLFFIGLSHLCRLCQADLVRHGRDSYCSLKCTYKLHYLDDGVSEENSEAPAQACHKAHECMADTEFKVPGYLLSDSYSQGCELICHTTLVIHVS